MAQNIQWFYLNKIISPLIFEWIDLTHEVSENIPTWNGDCDYIRLAPFSRLNREIAILDSS